MVRGPPRIVDVGIGAAGSVQRPRAPAARPPRREAEKPREESEREAEKRREEHEREAEKRREEHEREHGKRGRGG